MPGYKINAIGDNAEIILYGEILSDDRAMEAYGTKSISMDAFTQDLANVANCSAMTIRLNSAGGAVDTGIAIYNQLVSHPARKTVIVDGVAASAASVIAMAGDDVQMYPGSTMMIHGVKAYAEDYFSIDELKQLSRSIDASERAIAGIYAQKTGIHEKTIRAMMRKETWMTGAEAVELGFADTLLAAGSVHPQYNEGKRTILVNGVLHDLTSFHRPFFLSTEKGKSMTKRELLNLFAEDDKDKCAADDKEKDVPAQAPAEDKPAEDAPADTPAEAPAEKPADEEKENEGEPAPVEAPVEDPTDDGMTVEQLKTLYPDLIEQIKEEAKNEEAQRMADIEEIVNAAGLDDDDAAEVLECAKLTNKRPSVELVAVSLLKYKANKAGKLKAKATGNAFLQAMAADAKNAGTDKINCVATGATVTTPTDNTADIKTLMADALKKKGRN